MTSTLWMAAAIAAAALAAAAPAAQAQEAKAPVAKATPKVAPQPSFATPEDAVQALVDAVRASDLNRMLALMGPNAGNWILSGDKVSDASEWQRFIAAYDKKHSIEKQGDDKAILNAGDGDWWFPAPLVRKADKWSFDGVAGREETANRRVGHNELNTIQTLLAVVDAQREYAASDANGNGLIDYATRIRSTPGKRDGLYWPTQAGEPESPLGPLVARAVREGYGGAGNTGRPSAYHGYYYRLLTGQGKHAPGGAYSYLVNGRMFGGFAVIAYPATYGNSGVKSFIVNHDGVVYAKDLGPGSTAEAAKITRFDPGPGWTKVAP